MKLLIVGLGSMGKRRARLANGIDAAIELFGVDSSPARREEAAGLGITAYESIPAALKAGAYTAALVCTAPITHSAIIIRKVSHTPAKYPRRWAQITKSPL